MTTVREHALAAHAHSVTGLATTSKLKAALKSMIDLTDAIGTSQEAANFCIDSILAGTTPPGSPSQSDTGFPHVATILLCVGLVCGSMGANYSRGNGMETTTQAKNETDAGPLLNKAREAQLAREWNKACNLFTEAYKAGAGAEPALGRRAECEFYDGRMADAAATLDLLEKVSKGNSNCVPYLRGLIAFEAKNYPEAKKQFKLAYSNGNDRAGLMLKRIPQ